MDLSGALSNCLFYFVHLNSAGKPIPGTMFAQESNAKINPDNKCTIARLTPYQMGIPPGRVKCTDNNTHMRYWYMINSQTQKIVPNSFFETIGQPKSRCSGKNTILEFIVTKPAP